MISGTRQVKIYALLTNWKTATLIVHNALESLMPQDMALYEYAKRLFQARIEQSRS